MAQRHRIPPEPTTRYTWALHFGHGCPEARHISERAHIGLDYAHTLAQNHHTRSAHALRDRHHMPERLTIEKLAEHEGFTPTDINNYIDQAKRELFGKTLSQSAIYYRLKTRNKRRNRTCNHPNCTTPLQPSSTLTTLYCQEHGKPKYRTQRHRQAARQREHQRHGAHTDTEPPQN
jgi:hypothetical protein